MLMMDEDNKKYDSYIEKYIEAGKASIIGIGRKVQACKKDGSLVD